MAQRHVYVARHGIAGAPVAEAPTRMLVDLADAASATSGPKAASLAVLLRHGLPVPPGVVVPTRSFLDAVADLDPDLGGGPVGASTARAIFEGATVSPALVAEITAALARIAGSTGRGRVAVRSSATSEDGVSASAAGQHDSFLGLSGLEAVVDAVRRCWASVWSDRAVDYRQSRQGTAGVDPPQAAVLVQKMVDADVAGVLFTGQSTRVEASWGLGESVVGGRLTPDSWVVSAGTVTLRSVGAKTSRLDSGVMGTLRSAVGPFDRDRPCLTDEEVLRLARLAGRVESILGGPQDIEWALVDGQPWILQARPVTARLPDAPASSTETHHDDGCLRGAPASPGTGTGPARVVTGPWDFCTLRRGDVLVCRETDVAWAPLFGLVAAVVTETGGLLSHAAIVAREMGVPAVLAVPGATTAVRDGAILEVDGTRGRVSLVDRTRAGG